MRLEDSLPSILLFCRVCEFGWTTKDHVAVENVRILQLFKLGRRLRRFRFSEVPARVELLARLRGNFLIIVHVKVFTSDAKEVVNGLTIIIFVNDNQAFLFSPPCVFAALKFLNRLCRDF